MSSTRVFRTTAGEDCRWNLASLTPKVSSPLTFIKLILPSPQTSSVPFPYTLASFSLPIVPLPRLSRKPFCSNTNQQRFFLSSCRGPWQLYNARNERLAKYSRPHVPSGSTFSSKDAVVEVSNDVSMELLDEIIISFVSTILV